jgi:hypothetical protein
MIFLRLPSGEVRSRYHPPGSVFFDVSRWEGGAGKLNHTYFLT